MTAESSFSFLSSCLSTPQGLLSRRRPIYKLLRAHPSWGNPPFTAHKTMQLGQQTVPFPDGGQHGALTWVPSVTALETFRKALFWAHWQCPAALLFSPGRWCGHRWPPCSLVPGLQPGDRVSPAFPSAWSPEGCLPSARGC